MRPLPWSLLFVLVLSAATAGAERPVDSQAALREYARDLSRRLEQQRPPLYHRLRAGEAARGHVEGLPTLVAIDRNGLPMYFQVFNARSAETISTDDCWWFVDGRNVAMHEVGLWDKGIVDLDHIEFSGRVAAGTDSVPPTLLDARHATHVAGTILASGREAQAHGMAVNARLTAYDFENDASEMADAVAAGMLISNHSYGRSSGWIEPGADGVWTWMGDPTVNEFEDYYFGFYGPRAAEWDHLAVLEPDYLIVKAAGNERDPIKNSGPPEGEPHWVFHPTVGDTILSTVNRNSDYSDDGYDTIPLRGTAKNILTVGAVDSVLGGWSAPEDVRLTEFSSCGPTDDGRIKPDIVACGTSVVSTLPDGGYGFDDGTSYAAPAITGSCVLLIDRFRTTHAGTTPPASLLKAIVLHTADEAGDAPGPDYRFGWGLMNTLAASDVIGLDGGARNLALDEGRGGYLAHDELTSGATASYLAHHPGGAPLRITMAWTDPAGVPPPPLLDPTDPMLVHDLDLRIEPVAGGAPHQPWFLSLEAPATAAARGDNHRDNVEQVVVDAAPAGAYRVVVSHKGALQGPQAFSLVGSAPLALPDPVELLTNGDFDQGVAGFATDYAATNCYEPGHFMILNDADSCHSSWTGIDHTTGAGAFLAVNGATTSGRTVWAQQVALEPGTCYVFEIWSCPLESRFPADLEVRVGETLLGTIELNDESGTWSRARFHWTQVDSAHANLSIVDANVEYHGNDFGLDDLRVFPCAEISSVEDGRTEVTAAGFRLKTQPNPFNARTMLSFDLAKPDQVRLRVFDLAGRHVRTLLDGEAFGEGRHAVPWNGKDGNGRSVASGTYFYQAEVGGRREIGRVVLVR